MNDGTGAGEQYVRIVFPLEQDEDGYPPVTAERLWAIRVTDGLYQLDSIPFFARRVSSGDVVTAEEQQDGVIEFREVVRPSGHSTVRVLLHDEAGADGARQQFAGLGCAWEGSHLPSLFAVDIPPEVDYRAVRRLLREGAAVSRWEFEESSLADHVPED